MKKLMYGLVLLLVVVSPVKADSMVCNGAFPNPITDYCWSCIFPIRVAGFKLDFIGGQEDKPDAGSVDSVCSCGSNAINATVGLTTSFWEPTTMVDVVRKPFCLAGMGGLDMGDVIDSPPSGQGKVDGGAVSKSVFYQVHWYVNPILYWLEVLVDDDCIQRTPFDLGYLTEVDPLWNDEELTTILNPDVFLYANPLAQAACSVDCVAATSGFSNKEAYWCAGCQGSMFPLMGKVKNHNSIVSSSSLLLQRFTAKAHRELMIWGASGNDGLCKLYPKYMMDKTDYKYSMLFPVPQPKLGGTCCQPFGRTTALWGSGKTFPYYGEDVVYQLNRKRDCCVGKQISEMVGP